MGARSTPEALALFKMRSSMQSPEAKKLRAASQKFQPKEGSFESMATGTEKKIQEWRKLIYKEAGPDAALAGSGTIKTELADESLNRLFAIKESFDLMAKVQKEYQAELVAAIRSSGIDRALGSTTKTPKRK
jgi:hypothetical protein